MISQFIVGRALGSRKGSGGGGSFLKVVVAFAIVIVVLVTATGAVSIAAMFTDGGGKRVTNEQVVQVAEQAKYSDVKVRDRTSLIVGPLGAGCEGGDTVRYRVSGTNPAGERVKFYVCYGPENPVRVVLRK